MTEWKPIQNEYASSHESHSWTISTNNERGWATDSGYHGYGLPYVVAKWVCDTLNESKKTCPYTQDSDGDWEVEYD